MENFNPNEDQPSGPEMQPNVASEGTGDTQQSAQVGGGDLARNSNTVLVVLAAVIAGLVVLIAVLFLPRGPESSPSVEVANPVDGGAPSVDSSGEGSESALTEGDSTGALESDLDNMSLDDFEEDFSEIDQEIDQL